MVNLLKFKPLAEYADGTDSLTGSRPMPATARACVSWSKAWAARSAIPAP